VANALTPNAKQQFFDNNGSPLAGGKLFTYAAGTSTKLATKVSSAGADNTNPIILDYRGEANVWIPPNVAYKFVLAPSTDTDPPTHAIWTVDQVVSSQLITLYGGVDTGSVNAYVLNFTANFTTLTDGIVIYWLPTNTNTLSSTLNVNGLGAAPLVKADGTALTGNEVVSGQIAQVIYLSGSWRVITSFPISGTFTGTLTGVSGAAVTGTCRYTIAGRVVSVRLPQLTGPSNAATCTITGVPTFLSPSVSQVMPIAAFSFMDNTVIVNTVNASVSGAFPGTISFGVNGSVGGFTAAGTKGVNTAGIVLVWSLS
jgi:hypothetical protein